MALQTGEAISPGGVSDIDGRQVVTLSSASASAVASGRTATLAAGAGTPTAGASAQLVAANATRKGLQVVADVAAAANVYLLLGAGTASATNFHVSLAAGGSWDGLVSGQVWSGAVQFFSSGTPKVGVAEV